MNNKTKSFKTCGWTAVSLGCLCVLVLLLVLIAASVSFVANGNLELFGGKNTSDSLILLFVFCFVAFVFSFLLVCSGSAFFKFSKLSEENCVRHKSKLLFWTIAFGVSTCAVGLFALSMYNSVCKPKSTFDKGRDRHNHRESLQNVNSHTSNRIKRQDNAKGKNVGGKSTYSMASGTYSEQPREHQYNVEQTSEFEDFNNQSAEFGNFGEQTSAFYGHNEHASAYEKVEQQTSASNRYNDQSSNSERKGGYSEQSRVSDVVRERSKDSRNEQPEDFQNSKEQPRMSEKFKEHSKAFKKFKEQSSEKSDNGKKSKSKSQAFFDDLNIQDFVSKTDKGDKESKFDFRPEFSNRFNEIEFQAEFVVPVTDEEEQDKSQTVVESTNVEKSSNEVLDQREVHGTEDFQYSFQTSFGGQDQDQDSEQEQAQPQLEDIQQLRQDPRFAYQREDKARDSYQDVRGTQSGGQRRHEARNQQHYVYQTKFGIFDTLYANHTHSGTQGSQIGYQETQSGYQTQFGAQRPKFASQTQFVTHQFSNDDVAGQFANNESSQLAHDLSQKDNFISQTQFSQQQFSSYDMGNQFMSNTSNNYAQWANYGNVYGYQQEYQAPQNTYFYQDPQYGYGQEYAYYDQGQYGYQQGYDQSAQYGDQQGYDQGAQYGYQQGYDQSAQYGYQQGYGQSAQYEDFQGFGQDPNYGSGFYQEDAEQEQEYEYQQRYGA